jgi:hypothetical protein
VSRAWLVVGCNQSRFCSCGCSGVPCRIGAKNGLYPQRTTRSITQYVCQWIAVCVPVDRRCSFRSSTLTRVLHVSQGAWPRLATHRWITFGGRRWTALVALMTDCLCCCGGAESREQCTALSSTELIDSDTHRPAASTAMPRTTDLRRSTAAARRLPQKKYGPHNRKAILWTGL